jgi:plasmid stabilization system protein ParE
MTLRTDPAAEEELREAAAWYEQRRAGLGMELLVAVDVGVQQIRHSPQQGFLGWLPETENIRRLLLDRFPYAVIYEEDAEGIHILAIAHTRRQPGYWKNRG